MATTYNNKQRKVLYDKINTLSGTEHEEIFKIVKSHGISFSQNKNGIFFNLSVLTDEIVKEIENFVSYCMSNKQELDEYDKIINECKMSNHLKMPVSTQLNTSLGGMGRMEVDANPKKTGLLQSASWNNLKLHEGVVEKFVKFVDRMNADKEKVCKKKINLKFNNAKKRYSKKLSERKVEIEQEDLLTQESYIII